MSAFLSTCLYSVATSTPTSLQAALTSKTSSSIFFSCFFFPPQDNFTSHPQSSCGFSWNCEKWLMVYLTASPAFHYTHTFSILALDHHHFFLAFSFVIGKAAAWFLDFSCTPTTSLVKKHYFIPSLEVSFPHTLRYTLGDHSHLGNDLVPAASETASFSGARWCWMPTHLREGRACVWRWELGMEGNGVM